VRCFVFIIQINQLTKVEKIQQIKMILQGKVRENQRVYFSPDPAVNSAILRGISIPKVGTDISTTFNDQGATPLPNANFGDFYITLCNYKGEELHKNLVPYTLQPTNNSGKIKRIFNNNIDLSKSYLQFNRSVESNNTFILFNFILKYPDRKW